MSSKPNVLILGGCGFIGRHLTDYLISEDLVNELRVVDKTPPVMAWLNTKHTELFKNPKVEFKSANLINPVSCQNAFAPPPNDGKWNYVINCAGETKSAQTDAVYQEGILKLSLNCANEAVRANADRYVELSSANMNSSESTPHKEDSATEPWTFVAKYKLSVEKELKKIPNLKFTILRLPIVYGVGDRKGLTPRLIIAGLYRVLNETMKLLWTASMKLNTVHVSDVVAAAWELARNPICEQQVYNIVDNSNSTQGTITEILATIFNIRYDFLGVMMSSITKVDMAGVIENINDKHMSPWAEVCQVDKIDNTPLTPYMEEELLYHKHLHVCGLKLKTAGYILRKPVMTVQDVQEIVDDFVNQGIFPRSLVVN